MKKIIILTLIYAAVVYVVAIMNSHHIGFSTIIQTVLGFLYWITHFISWHDLVIVLIILWALTVLEHTAITANNTAAIANNTAMLGSQLQQIARELSYLPDKGLIAEWYQEWKVLHDPAKEPETEESLTKWYEEWEASQDCARIGRPTETNQNKPEPDEGDGQ